jgi:lysophospholipase L1-like esterase
LKKYGEKRAAYHMRNFQNGKQIAAIILIYRSSTTYWIKLCKEHNITPILITTPYRSYYSNWFSNEILEQFYCELIDPNENDVIYLDYSRDERFNNSEELLKDTDHLNKQGAIVFTEIVIKDLFETRFAEIMQIIIWRIK